MHFPLTFYFDYTVEAVLSGHHWTCSTIHMYISGCSNIFSYIFAS